MVKVRPSNIEAKGVFALVDFRRSERVGELWGELITSIEGERRARRRKRIAIVELDEALAIDASKSDYPCRYLNHSCEPNTFMRIGDGWIRFYAKRIIRSGEELTCDYGENHHAGKLPCRCGSPKCRGFLLDNPRLHRLTHRSQAKDGTIDSAGPSPSHCPQTPHHQPSNP